MFIITVTLYNVYEKTIIMSRIRNFYEKSINKIDSVFFFFLVLKMSKYDKYE